MKYFNVLNLLIINTFIVAESAYADGAKINMYGVAQNSDIKELTKCVPYIIFLVLIFLIIYAIKESLKKKKNKTLFSLFFNKYVPILMWAFFIGIGIGYFSDIPGYENPIKDYFLCSLITVIPALLFSFIGFLQDCAFGYDYEKKNTIK